MGAEEYLRKKYDKHWCPAGVAINEERRKPYSGRDHSFGRSAPAAEIVRMNAIHHFVSVLPRTYRIKWMAPDLDSLQHILSELGAMESNYLFCGRLALASI